MSPPPPTSFDSCWFFQRAGDSMGPSIPRGRNSFVVDPQRSLVRFRYLQHHVYLSPVSSASGQTYRARFRTKIIVRTWLGVSSIPV